MTYMVWSMACLLIGDFVIDIVGPTANLHFFFETAAVPRHFIEALYAYNMLFPHNIGSLGFCQLQSTVGAEDMGNSD